MKKLYLLLLLFAASAVMASALVSVTSPSSIPEPMIDAHMPPERGFLPNLSVIENLDKLLVAMKSLGFSNTMTIAGMDVR